MKLIERENQGARRTERVKRRQPVLIASGIVWFLMIGAGLLMLWNYELSPGVSGTPPAQWPADSSIRRTPGIANLIMLAHPRCSCTRASIGELARIMARCQGLVSAHVIFFKPSEFPEDWEKTDLWRSAAAIPGVDVTRDEDGVEARRFRTFTSGGTVLYDADGRLLFSGGITPSRAHYGDNAGSSAITSLLTRGTASRKENLVFGCPLIEANSKPNGGCSEHENLEVEVTTRHKSSRQEEER